MSSERRPGVTEGTVARADEKIFLQIKKNGLDLRCGVACATGDIGRFPSFRRHPEYRGEQGGRLFNYR